MRLPGLSRPAGLLLATVATACLLAASAWAQSQPTLPTPLPVPSAPASPAPPAPAAAPVAPAAGTPAPGGSRDPFEPLVRPVQPSQPSQPSQPGERRVQELETLKLVGILWDAKDPQMIRALVETPDGLGYYLRLNEQKFGGKVVAVERDRVRFVVREQIQGARTQERTVEIRLKSDGP
jgi:Tfp pilus assembly protein PilP